MYVQPDVHKLPLALRAGDGAGARETRLRSSYSISGKRSGLIKGCMLLLYFRGRVRVFLTMWHWPGTQCYAMQLCCTESRPKDVTGPFLPPFRKRAADSSLWHAIPPPSDF